MEEFDRLSEEDIEIETRDILFNYEPDFENDLYPFAIVWTVLPIISWIIPIIGHVGICDSEGVIHDFQGSCYVARNDFAFGRTLKYIPL